MKDELIIDSYFRLTKEYRLKYPNSKVAILMQVGSFYEIYGYEKNNEVDVSYSELDEISKICDFSVANKKRVNEKERYVMAGFPDHIGLDKYVSLLMKSNFIVPVFNQTKDENGTVLERVCEYTYSPGTFVNSSLTQLNSNTNYIMCIWFQIYKKPTGEYLKIAGSAMNMYSSDSYLFEYDKKYIFDSTTFDELANSLRIYQPHEVIFISDFDNSKIDDIMQFCGIQDIHNHNYTFSDKLVKNVEKQTYQRTIIENTFGVDSYDKCFEFRKLIAMQSFCFLLDFINSYNSGHLSNIKFPVFEDLENKMKLANHTLMQLNIVSTSEGQGEFGSVLSMLNKTRTSMGKRLFQEQLCNPSTNIEWMKKEYKFIELFRNQEKKIGELRKELSNIIDLEKFFRKANCGNINPSDIFRYNKSVLTIKRINKYFQKEHSEIYAYTFDKELYEEYFNEFENLIEEGELWLAKTFDMEKCGSINRISEINDSIFIEGYNESLDKINSEYTCKRDTLNENMEKFFGLYSVKRNEQRDDLFYTITLKRSKDWRLQNKDIRDEYEFKKAAGANVKITGKYDDVCKDVITLKNKLVDSTRLIYKQAIPHLVEKLGSLNTLLCTFISKLDVLLTKVFISEKYNYCQPIIEENEKSFVKIEELRHCLIENIQLKEIYVGNDIELGTNKDGILLYGTNAVGKTSLIRALGIAVIMAQAGMYVPSKSFVFYPYTALYSRILNSDNLFRGLSTFALEMSELRVILNEADQNSLVLGDELCSGTEMQSALGIVAAGLEHLHKKQSSFIFATHFHEIVDLEEINKLKRLVFYHLTVKYNYEKEELEYDRKLKEGSGDRVYGLEVCKSLYLPRDFIDRAYQIRNKQYPENEGYLSYKPSKYNKNVLRGKCVKCKKKMSTETHHILQQKDADKNGFVNGVHKNHAANLMVLCEDCHLKEHH